MIQLDPRIESSMTLSATIGTYLFPSFAIGTLAGFAMRSIDLAQNLPYCAKSTCDSISDHIQVILDLRYGPSITVSVCVVEAIEDSLKRVELGDGLFDLRPMIGIGIFEVNKDVADFDGSVRLLLQRHRISSSHVDRVRWNDIKQTVLHEGMRL